MGWGLRLSGCPTEARLSRWSGIWLRQPPGRLLEDSLRLPSHVHKVTEPGVLLPLQEAHLAAVGIGEAREAVRAAHEEGLAGYSYPGSFEDGAQRRYAFDPLAVGGDVRPAFEGREWYRMYGADCPTIDPTTALLIGKPMMMQYGPGTGGSPFPLVYRVGPMNEEAATAITEVAAQLLYPDDNFDYPSYHATTFGSKYYELATYIERPSFQEV